jgi:hypothetical protein
LPTERSVKFGFRFGEGKKLRARKPKTVWFLRLTEVAKNV